MRVFIIKFKNTIIPFCIYVFTFFLILYSSSNLNAAKEGLLLWAISVVPSMLPFFIATELLSFTNITSILGKLLNKIMRPIFNVPGEGAFALIMGIISGYPVGAKIVSNFKLQSICTDIECERLISFTNNSSPLFIVGTTGISMFYSQKIGFILFIVHILSCLLVGFIFRFWKKGEEARFVYTKRSNKDVTIKISNLGEILSYSIQSAIKSVLIIGGFIILFSVIISMLKSSQILNVFSKIINPFLYVLNIPNTYSSNIIIGLIEVTNGLKLVAIPNNNISIIICSFLLGFGGISVLLQIFSITSKAKISIKPYIIGKILQACFSAIFMWIILYKL